MVTPWFILFLIVLPFERVPSFDMGGLTIRMSTLVLAAGFLLFGSVLWGRRNHFSSLDWAGLSIWLYSLMSSFWAQDARRSLIVSGVGLFIFGASLVISELVSKQKEAWILRMMEILVLAAVGVSLLGIGEQLGAYYTGSSIPGLSLAQYSPNVLGFPRVYSVALEPLYFALFLLAPILFTGFQVLRGVNMFGKRFLAEVSFFILFSAFILTVSRGAYVALAVATAAATVTTISLRPRQHGMNIGKLVGLSTLAVVCAASVVVIISGTSSLSKIVNHIGLANKVSQTNGIALTPDVLDDGSLGDEAVAGVDSRIVLYQEAIRIGRENLLVGVGAGNFGRALQRGAEVPDGKQIANNLYLEIFAEQGVVGVGLFAIWLYLVARTARKVLRKYHQNELFLVALAVSFGLLAIGVQYLFLSTFSILIVWVLIGFLRGLELKK